MRVRRPGWMEPVESFGEWFGLLGGVLVVAAIVLAVIWAIPRWPHPWWCIDPTDKCNTQTHHHPTGHS